MRDWRNPEDYKFCQNLSPESWAWQFLRRNPEYQQDYEQFIVTWRALEADYGVAPNRDFSRWKLDPRAYASEEMTQGLCDDDKSCASVSGNKVLLECAMGAKWGFYKFPNSPDIEFPDVPEQLIWRELDIRVATPAGEALPYHADLRFDLRLPVKEQLASAKKQLVIQQRKLQKQGEGFNVGTLSQQLRLIDAADSDDQEIAALLCNGDIEALAGYRQQALMIIESDYRLLAIAAIK